MRAQGQVPKSELPEPASKDVKNAKDAKEQTSTKKSASTVHIPSAKEFADAEVQAITALLSADDGSSHDSTEAAPPPLPVTSATAKSKKRKAKQWTIDELVKQVDHGQVLMDWEKEEYTNM